MAATEGWRFRWGDVSSGSMGTLGRAGRGIRFSATAGFLVLSSRRGLWWLVLLYVAEYWKLRMDEGESGDE